jgi:hypothetical protein
MSTSTSSSSSNRRGGGRGVGLAPPSRQSTQVRPAAATPSSPAPVAALQSPSPRPIIAFQIVQQCQEFLVQLAWQEVRQAATMTIASQKTALLTSYSRFVNLFLQNAIPAANSSYPNCPEALRISDRTSAVALLHQSTQTGRSSLSKDALYRKAKKGVQKLLKYMGDWTRICKDPNTRPGDFVPSVPPSGTDRDFVWTKIKSTEHRSNECLKIWKRRSANQHLPENTPDAIREALVHLNFARRGYSLDEEMHFRGQVEIQSLNEEEEAVWRQISEEVDAGEVSGVLADSDDENPNTSRSITQTSTAPRGYFETPYCEIQGNYHLLELAAKAFTQYAGHGHDDISMFYTSEWADYQRTQSSLGATGRTQQRRVQQLEREQALETNHHISVSGSGSGGASVFPSQTSAASLSSSSMHHFEQLTQQMQMQNSIAQHSRILNNMEKAISLAKAMNKPSADVSRLQQRCLDFLVDDINRELPANQPSVQRATAIQSSYESLPPIRRRRMLNESQTLAIQQIEVIGSVEDNPGEGNCLFYCLAAIEQEFLEL